MVFPNGTSKRLFPGCVKWSEKVDMLRSLNFWFIYFIIRVRVSVPNPYGQLTEYESLITSSCSDMYGHIWAYNNVPGSGLR